MRVRIRGFYAARVSPGNRPNSQRLSQETLEWTLLSAAEREGLRYGTRTPCFTISRTGGLVDAPICLLRFRRVAWLPVSFSRRFTMGMIESLSDLRHLQIAKLAYEIWEEWAACRIGRTR
jgi:hypothetical protein